MYFFYSRLRNSATVIAVATATLRLSVVILPMGNLVDIIGRVELDDSLYNLRSAMGKLGIRRRCDTRDDISEEIPLPSLPMTTIPFVLNSVL